jgi:hypothetical protein
MPPSPHLRLDGREPAREGRDDDLDAAAGCLLGVVLGVALIFAVIMLACAVRVLA